MAYETTALQHAFNYKQHLGKYKQIILAIALFLLLDLAVLVLNFYISYDFSNNAKVLSLAARQGSLLQNMSKSLHVLHNESSIPKPNVTLIENEVAELKDAADLFNGTQIWLEKGGKARALDDSAVAIDALDPAQFASLFINSQAVWQPYQTLLNPIVNSETPSADAISAAAQYAQSNTSRLIDTTNLIATQIEADVSTRAYNLRLIQALGMLMAILNFGFILFKFIRKLRQSDTQVELAQLNTTEILNSVNQGLFLINSQYVIASQMSKALTSVLETKINAGDDFRKVLSKYAGAELVSMSVEYIRLLFAAKLNNKLAKSFNPLETLSYTNEKGVLRHLNFKFNLIQHPTEGQQVLVSISDITSEKNMLDNLVLSRKNIGHEFKLVTDLLKVNSDDLQHFLNAAYQKLLSINLSLKMISAVGQQKLALQEMFLQLNELYQAAHGVGFGFFTNDIKLFEGKVQAMLKQEDMVDDDMLGLLEPIEDLLNKISLVRKLNTDIAPYRAARPHTNLTNKLVA